jgi:hypothetical protein
MRPVDLVDIGANLTHPDFRRDLPAVLDRDRARILRPPGPTDLSRAAGPFLIRAEKRTTRPRPLGGVLP